ncbi:HAD family hydrolase [Kitasatospora griseola]|uniref:HAD family hydrolase n=1 Tax=Kitasatospora griseola TaxID=2064 RepID=UPI00166FDA23|nr:HAD family hydrolase [Kitasatospora griseola]GGQ85095.1 haloacid dehalogenase [Kitasatospora griseola]
MIESSKPVELVIFDCDGVLVDSERIAVRVQREVGAQLGWPLTEDEVVRHFIGRSHAAGWQVVAERLGESTAAAWEQRFEQRHRELVDTELEPVDGIVEALTELAAAGLPHCVASSGTHGKMRHTLGRTGLYERFEGRIFSATEVAHGKPAPDLFLHAAQRMGFAPEVCAVVEDSGPGTRAARAAGMRCFGYTGGPTGADALTGPGTVLFSDMRQLPELLRTSHG